jgi:hypothetical protein
MSKEIWVATVLAFGALAACSRQPGNLASATSLAGCNKDDQCGSDELCVFRLCTPRCAGDRSCEHGATCFDTGRGPACLLREYNACVDDTDCPSATTCNNKRCASDCEPDAGEACGDCSNGLCISEGQSSSDASTPDAGAPASCAAGSTQCRNGMVLQCDAAGQLQPREACPFVCTEGACSGTCKPGELRCDALNRQQCDDRGTWKTLEQCPTSCQPAACEGACVNGTRDCNDDMLMVCRGGRMVALATCDYVCRSGACSGSCTPGAHSCRGNSVLTCGADAQWATPVACPSVCSAGACTGDCSPGQQRCDGTTAYQTCDRRGQWGNSTDCRGRACVNGSCSGVCTPGAVRCEAGAALSTCGDDGQWGPPQPCAAGACENGACVEPCAPENLRCLPGDAAQPQVCNATGQWTNLARCPPRAACVEGACRGECTPAARRCSPDDPRSVQTCSQAGEWQPGMPCAPQQRCGGEGVCGLSNTCPAGESPAWWDGADGVDRTLNDPRWGGALETFGNQQQSMPAGYAIVFDRQANQLAVTIRTTAEDAAAPSDFVYFGIAGNAGMPAQHAARIALVAANAAEDPRSLAQITSYEYAMASWTSADLQPAWLAHPAAWVASADKGWAVSFRVDLAAAGVDAAAPFRVALGLHAENQFGQLDWVTPASLALTDLASAMPRLWPSLDVSSVMCVSRVDVR